MGYTTSFQKQVMDIRNNSHGCRPSMRTRCGNKLCAVQGDMSHTYTHPNTRVRYTRSNFKVNPATLKTFSECEINDHYLTNSTQAVKGVGGWKSQTLRFKCVKPISSIRRQRNDQATAVFIDMFKLPYSCRVQ